MVFLKEQAEQFLGQPVMRAEGSARGFPFDRLKNQELTSIQTFGKELLFCFPGFAVRVHLLLFGKYAINGKLNRELRLGLAFDNGEINFYACGCRFMQEPLESLYDWSTDVLHASFDTDKALEKLCRKPNRIIGEALLDQTILAGVGNGIKNEVLFRNRIHPESLVGEIPEPEVRRLIAACTSFSFEYLDWIREGRAEEHWLVYKRKECPRDHIPLLKAKIGKWGRSSYFCEKCQQLFLPDG